MGGGKIKGYIRMMEKKMEATMYILSTPGIRVWTAGRGLTSVDELQSCALQIERGQKQIFDTSPPVDHGLVVPDHIHLL